jgi:hypothetical protein
VRTTSEIFSPFGVIGLSLSCAMLGRISCGWFVDFGWIFMQLGLNSLGFLDEVSNFLQFYDMLLM